MVMAMPSSTISVRRPASLIISRGLLEGLRDRMRGSLSDENSRGPIAEGWPKGWPLSNG